MSATDKSTEEEARSGRRAELKIEKQERFKLFYESLGAKRTVYYAIRVYEDRW